MLIECAHIVARDQEGRNTQRTNDCRNVAMCALSVVSSWIIRYNHQNSIFTYITVGFDFEENLRFRKKHTKCTFWSCFGKFIMIPSICFYSGKYLNVAPNQTGGGAVADKARQTRSSLSSHLVNIVAMISISMIIWSLPWASSSTSPWLS